MAVEEVRTEIVADGAKHSAAFDKAVKDTQAFGKQSESTAKQLAKTQQAQAREAAQWADAIAKAHRRAAQEAETAAQKSTRAAASAAARDAATGRRLEGISVQALGTFGALSGASDGVAQKVGMATLQVSDMGKMLGSLAGASGGAMGALGKVGVAVAALAGPIGLGLAAGLALGKGLRSWFYGDQDKKDAADTIAILESLKGLGPVQPRTTFQKRPETFDDDATPDWATPKQTKGKGRAAAQEGAGARAAQEEDRQREAVDKLVEANLASAKAYDEKRRATLASVEAIDQAIAKEHELRGVAEASAAEAKDAALLAKVDKAIGLEGGEDAEGAEERRAQESMAALGESKAALAQTAGVDEGGFGINMGVLLFGEEDPTGQTTLDATNNMAVALVTVADAASQAGEAIARMAIGKVMDAAIGPSIRYVHANKEAAKAAKAMQLSTSESIKVGTRDILKGIATEAAIKAVLEGAMAIAAAARGRWDQAGTHAAAAAAMGAVAAAAGVAAASIGPVTKKAPSGGGARADSGGGGGGGVGLGAETKAASETLNLVINVMPGTEASRIWDEAERGLNRARRERGRPELK